MLYLATPYSHESPEIQRERYLKACRITAVLMRAGVPVFSPLLNSVPAVTEGGLEIDHSGFMAVDLPILRRCDEVLIVGIDGWDKSKGVLFEMTEAFIHKIPVTLSHRRQAARKRTNKLQSRPVNSICRSFSNAGHWERESSAWKFPHLVSAVWD